VGPAANSSRSTPAVASRPSVVITPATRLSPIAATVSRGLACQARPTASRTMAGSRRATAQKLVLANSSAWCSQPDAFSSGMA
jgi:hypothetical protein